MKERHQPKKFFQRKENGNFFARILGVNKISTNSRLDTQDNTEIPTTYTRQYKHTEPKANNNRFGLICDIGDVKRSNQDCIFACNNSFDGQEFGVFLVADGMGGMAYGEVASSIACQKIAQWYHEEFLPAIYKNNISSAIREVDNTIQMINKTIICFAEQVGQRVGTTLTLCIIVGKSYIIRHVGDSRVYCFTQGECQQLTKDHSFVASELEKGNITIEEAINHPRKNVLTQCIGVHKTLDVFHTSGVINNKDDNFIILCSDGFHNYFPWERLNKILKKFYGENLQLVVDEMRACIPIGQAKDNVSCIVVHIPPHIK